jgi:hypothetical protein
MVTAETLKIMSTRSIIPSDRSGPVVGWLIERDGAPKLLGSKFIKQTGSHSAGSHPKAEL